LGFYISVAGVVTFPRAGDLRDVVRSVPVDRLLVETDSPYLAPVPHRGRRNEPAYVSRVLETVASARGLAPEELDARITQNFTRLLGPNLAHPRA
jgi:TatD DNase family protein